MQAVPDTKVKSKQKKFRVRHQKNLINIEPRISVLVWGIQHSISELSQIPNPIMLVPDDFKSFGKAKKTLSGVEVEDLPSRFKVKYYCPVVFRYLRDRFNIDEVLFQRSFQTFPDMSDASGNSGSKLYLTQNKVFYVKSISADEVESMHSFLPKYHQYIVEKHASTLLPKYIGLYRVSMDGKYSYYLILLNVFSTTKVIHLKYDLKGSKVDREAKERKPCKEGPTLKDCDFLNDNQKLFLNDATKKTFLEKLKQDVDFLHSLGVMDYSLLVGIHDKEHTDTEEEDGDAEENDDAEGANETSPTGMSFTDKCAELDGLLLDENESHAVESSNGRYTYYLGLIDVLTHYGLSKKAAHGAKTVKHGAGAEISTVKPGLYASRFYDFIVSCIE